MKFNRKTKGTEKLKKYSIVYWAISSPSSSPGIQNKVKDFIETAIDMGHDAIYILKEPGSYLSYIKSLVKVLRSDKQIVLYRYNNMMGSVLLLMIILSRLLGKKVVLDVPTPIIHHLKSIYIKKRKGARDVFEFANALLLGPLPFVFANLVIHYSKENNYFLPNKFTKSILIGNGVRTSKWPILAREKNNNPKRLRLIGVGAIAEWHAWEKIIKAISICRDEAPDFSITFTIVGFGSELNLLKLLSQKYALENEIIFTGLRYGEELTKFYLEADLGVGSFGWSKLGITVASPLKYREYLSNGLPFIYSTDDPDIPRNNGVAFMIEPDEVVIAKFLMRLEVLNLPSPEACREFCKNNMDYSKKIPMIIRSISEN